MRLAVNWPTRYKRLYKVDSVQFGNNIAVIQTMRTQALLPLLLFVMSFNAQDASNSTYGNNLITVSPFSAYGSDEIDDIFVGLNYERFLNDIMSIGSQFAVGLQDEGFQIGLAPKFYPSGHDKAISYSLAPTFLYTNALSSNYFYSYYDSSTGNYIYNPKDNRVSQFGFMLVNSMNATLNEQIHFSLEGGLGVNYVSNFEVNTTFNSGPSITGLLRCSMGYRF